MRIMVTNDDGIWAPGIRVLVEELEPFGEITVVAPERPRSAVSHAITLHKPLRLQSVDFDGLEVEAYAVNGTPSDAVIMGVMGLMGGEGAADMVVSGINHGPNVAEDVIYSGTVAGAMEGIMVGARAVSISLATFDEPDWRLTRSFLRSFFADADFDALPPNSLLNINVPSIEPSQCKGVAVTRLGARKFRDVIQRRSDPRGRAYYWLAGEKYFVDYAPGLDTTAVRDGFISITPLTLDMTDNRSLPAVSEFVKGFSMEGCG